jgi:hypothetical protein
MSQPGTPSAMPVPMTGQPTPELATVNAVMDDLMVRWQLPGGQVALTDDGHRRKAP